MPILADTVICYTLEDAADRFLGGAVTASTLRAEISRGNLAAAKIGRRYFVTEADIKVMIERCRAPAKAPASISMPTAKAGPSEAERKMAVLVCQETVKKLRDSGRAQKAEFKKEVSGRTEK